MEVQWLQQKWSYLLYFTHRIYLISFNRTTAPGQLQGVKIHALSHLSLFPCRLALKKGREEPTTTSHASQQVPPTAGPQAPLGPSPNHSQGAQQELECFLFCSSIIGLWWAAWGQLRGALLMGKERQEERSRKDLRPWDSLPTHERLPDAWDQQHHTSLARTEMAAVWIITA